MAAFATSTHIVSSQPATAPTVHHGRCSFRGSWRRAPEAKIGSTVAAENYYQHAEHYFRSITAIAGRLEKRTLREFLQWRVGLFICEARQRLRRAAPDNEMRVLTRPNP